MRPDRQAKNYDFDVEEYRKHQAIKTNLPTTPLVIHITRGNHTRVTPGVLKSSAGLTLYTSELPYKGNQRNISCIPIGNYPAKVRFSEKFGFVLELTGITGRSGILIHAGNDPITDSRGCILVGRVHTPGMNVARSREAMSILLEHCRTYGGSGITVKITQNHK